ncbi:MAG: methylated-DNA--[protein]-cysteine S-methyltransferase [Actinomycetota bacterium]|nr:methylated-DNA--[protein]-cysteine S-methyltransferase [Actinomycetota bacterium]
MNLIVRSVASPIGLISLAGDGERLSGVYMTDHKRAPLLDGARRDDEAFAETVRQLAEWFDGRRTTFDLAVDPRGTAFQLTVWKALVDIPFGETVTYGELAANVGQPGAARAIGHAVARNPVSIIVPCHRVVGAKGVLTGFAGGLERKRWLLDHERTAAVIPKPAPRRTLGDR